LNTLVAAQLPAKQHTLILFGLDPARVRVQQQNRIESIQYKYSNTKEVGKDDFTNNKH
jgi:hypothetical protein